MHETNEGKGGVSLDVLKQECPEDLRAALFDDAPVIPWLRIESFQILSLKLIAEASLRQIPAYATKDSAPELKCTNPKIFTRPRDWRFDNSHMLYVSPNNPGAAAFAQRLVAACAPKYAQRTS